MPKETPQPPPQPEDFLEEAVPFDDVLRRLLAAKPIHRKAPDPKPEPEQKPRDP